MRRMLVTVAVVLVSTLVFAQAPQGTAQRYFPPPGEWQRARPADAGMDQAKLAEAITHHLLNQNSSSWDLAEATLRQFANEAPYNTLIGPTQERTAANGIVIRRGKVVAEWGDTNRADMTFSVTKSFLSTVVGVAYDRGLITDLNAKVAGAMPKGVDLFTSEHNAKITWDHLLRQTSHWHGTLWTKPSWADRPPRNMPLEEWPKRPLEEPGTIYTYNDTRVNVLGLATLYVMKQPLPAVLKQAIMDPIGASSTWHWEAYDNAWVTIDGKKMPSITGGGHFGGGMFISAWDMARFGYLFLNNGKWGGRQLISQKWIDMARTPGTARNAGSSTYGFMNWMLNVPQRTADGSPGRKQYPTSPDSAVSFNGNGENIIYIDWENDIVAVVRWARGASQVVARVVASITP
jgi:CubicO group peptidase (beta-lactamase class C family)